jgi:hypothetical protein
MKKDIKKIKNIKKNDDFFNFIFSLIFLSIFIFEIYFISEYEIKIGLVEILLFSLAIFRLTVLMVYDGITQFFRDFFLKVTYRDDGEILRKKYDYGFKKSVSDILGCP